MIENTAAVLLTGMVGVGKTVLAVEMANILESEGHTPAAIDLDWLGWISGPGIGPDDVTALIRENLAALWGNLRKRAPSHVILCRFVVDREEIAGIRSALNGLPFAVMRVNASRGTIEDRLRRRDSGAELAEHLSIVEAMTQGLQNNGVGDLVIENETDLTTTALEALAQLEWRKK